MNSLLLPLALVCSAGLGNPASTVQSGFKVVHQPDRQSKPEGDTWGRIDVQIPAAMQFVASDPPSRQWTPTKIGSAYLSDADGHRVLLGLLYQPMPGQTSYGFSLNRGYGWHWTHPRLELEITDRPTETLKLRDLPERESANLPEELVSANFTLEAVHDLQKAGLGEDEHHQPLPSVPGFVLSPTQPLTLGPGETVEAALSATDSAPGLASLMFQSIIGPSDKPGKMFIPYAYAESTKVGRIAIRRIKKGPTSFEVEVPGCRLVSRFGGSGFELDHDATVHLPNGWKVTVPRQYSGPFRDVKRDLKRIDIRCDVITSFALRSTGTYDDQAYEQIRRWDADQSSREWGVSLVSPTPSDLGLSWVQIRGNHFTGSESDAPVKYGDFTLKLKVTALVTQELSLEGYTVKVTPAKQ